MTECSPLFNLILFAQEEKRVSYLEGIVAHIREKFCCQIIFIHWNRSGSHPLKVEKSPQYNTIHSYGKGIESVPNALFPLLVTDLPILLLWGDDPSKDNPLLSQLVPYASRLIFDSEGADRLDLFAKSVLSHMECFKCDCLDLNWLRLGGWRKVFLQVFENKEKIELLKNSKRIHISFNHIPEDNHSHPIAQARYLQAWLATQLKWKLKESSGHHIEYTHGQKDITIELKPVVDNHFRAGSILSIETTSHDDQYYVLSRKGETPTQVRVDVSTLEMCNLPFTVQISNPQIGFSFSKEILYGPTSSSYKALLSTLSRQGK